MNKKFKTNFNLDYIKIKEEIRYEEGIERKEKIKVQFNNYTKKEVTRCSLVLLFKITKISNREATNTTPPKKTQPNKPLGGGKM